MENSEINYEKLPFVPCKEGQTVFKGLVRDENGLIVGRFDPNQEQVEIEPKIILWSDFNKIQFPENRWIIRDWIPAGGFVILASPTGEKKSWLALAMANSIARGEKFLGEYESTQGAVLYLNGEMSDQEIQRRGRLLNLTNTPNLWFVNQELDFYKEERNIIWLFETIEKYKITTVFIDTFRAYAGGIKEEKAEEIRLFMNKLKPLKNQQVGVVMLDHFRKPTYNEGSKPKKEQLFASQDKGASVESVFMLKSNARKEEIYIYHVKNRIGNEMEPIEVTISDQYNENMQQIGVSILFKGKIEEQAHKQELGEEIISSCLSEGGKTTNEIIAILKSYDISPRTAREAIRSMESKGLITMPHKQGKQNFYILKKETPAIEILI